jgi:hypothetical protein
MAIRKKNKVSVSTQDAVAELFEKLHTAGCDPIKELAQFAMDVTTPLDTRISILKDLAQYTAPKRRAVDINPGSDDGITVKIIKYTKDTVGQTSKMMKPEVAAAARVARAEGRELGDDDLDLITGGAEGITEEETLEMISEAATG